MSQSPLVSVVTPFYNTAPFLGECIERTLAQTYDNFELVLVNNCSNDGSREIAERYAKLDPRIRLLDNSRFVGQVENYNNALLQISPQSVYCKIVQADDWIVSDCLRSMVEVAQRDSRIGIVGSLYLHGMHVKGVGIPADRWKIDGKELCRMQLLQGLFFMGSPTTLMYRSDIVRSREPFYALGRYHEDTEAAYEILSQFDFGFCHRVLSYIRVHGESIMGQRESFNPNVLDRRIIIERYGKLFLTESEYAAQVSRARKEHERFLGECAIRLKSRALWSYHAEGLQTIGQRIAWHRVGLYAARAVMDLLVHPVSTARRLFHAAARRSARNSSKR